MKVEGAVMERRGGLNVVGYGNSNKVLKKKKKKVKSRKISRKLPIQLLYLACKTVFKGLGFIPLPCDVESLCRIIDDMKPEDVGLSRNLKFFKTGNSEGEKPRVTCTTIYSCNDFSLALFFMPQSAVIPFHNHPEMTVFSKLLLGTLHIKSYDWVESEANAANSKHRSTKPGLAKLVVDDNFTAPCDTTVLYPTTGGNLHRFTAVTPCIVLDVMGPPYSKDDGRDCSYYKELPWDADKYEEKVKKVKLEDNTGGKSSSYGWLQEIEPPEESKMEGIQYLGPPIIET